MARTKSKNVSGETRAQVHHKTVSVKRVSMKTTKKTIPLKNPKQQLQIEEEEAPFIESKEAPEPSSETVIEEEEAENETTDSDEEDVEAETEDVDMEEKHEDENTETVSTDVKEGDEVDTEGVEGAVEHKNNHRKGFGRRAINRETNNVDTIISKAGMKRLSKSLLDHLAHNDIIKQKYNTIKATGFPKGLHIAGYGNGTDGRGGRHGRKFVVEANKKLSYAAFRKKCIPVLQTSNQTDMMKVIEHTFRSRINQMSDKQRSKSQNKGIRIKAKPLLGEFYNYWSEKDIEVIHYFKHFATFLGKRCFFPKPRVV